MRRVRAEAAAVSTSDAKRNPSTIAGGKAMGTAPFTWLAGADRGVLIRLGCQRSGGVIPTRNRKPIDFEQSIEARRE